MKSCVPRANKLWVTSHERKDRDSVHIDPHALHSFYRRHEARKPLAAKGFAPLSHVLPGLISYY
jgi:hypothetical protein